MNGLLFGKIQLLNNFFYNKGAYIIKLPYFLYIFFISLVFITTLNYLLYTETFWDFKLLSFTNVIKFTFLQAFIATAISITLGFLFSLILYISGKNQKIISSFLNFCFILPVIFISFGFIFFFSSKGPVSVFFQYFFDEYSFRIFSLSGIIIVTSYFNIALNANFFFRKLVNIPENYLKILKLNGIPFSKSIVYQLRSYIFSGYFSVLILTLVFCIGNFTIVYLLAGSPNLTTIELAIYQSINFDANLKNGIILGIIQLVIILFFSSFALSKTINFNSTTSFKKTVIYRKSNIIFDILFWIIVSIFCVPFLVLFKGLYNFNLNSLFSYIFFECFFNSIFVSISSLTISLILSLSSLSIYRELMERNFLSHKIIFTSISILLFVPSLSLSAMIFYLNFTLGFLLNNFLIVTLINSFFITPIIFIFLINKFMENSKSEYRNSYLFNIHPLIRLIYIDMPKIRNELLLISSAVFILSLGDLTSVTIFNDSSFKTIPLYISQLYSSYRYDDAFFILSIFIIFILILMFISLRYIFLNDKIKKIKF